MSAQFFLGVVVALLLLANWVTLYSRSDTIYQFQDGEMKVVAQQLQASGQKATWRSQAKAKSSNDAVQVSAAQFGALESYFNAAAGLCPSQRENVVDAPVAPQHSLLVDSIPTHDFRVFLDAVLSLNSDTKSILDVRAPPPFAICFRHSHSLLGGLRECPSFLPPAAVSHSVLALRVAGRACCAQRASRVLRSSMFSLNSPFSQASNTFLFLAAFQTDRSICLRGVNF
jgi:hypothetical protein